MDRHGREKERRIRRNYTSIWIFAIARRDADRCYLGRRVLRTSLITIVAWMPQSPFLIWALLRVQFKGGREWIYY